MRVRQHRFGWRPCRPMQGSIGELTAGETVYVAVGPNGLSGSDSFNRFDFSIMVVPEPASLSLAAVGLIGLLVLVRRRRPG